MQDKCKQAFEDAAKKILQLPPGYDTLKIKDSIPTRQDWDDLNRAFCLSLDGLGCDTVQASGLDPFWIGNKTFGELLQYVEDNCDCE